MERVQNYYCLRTLNDWLLAQEQGIVKKMKKEQESLEKILELAGCDCLPLNLICARCNGNNYMLADEQWDKLFRFLDNKITIDNGRRKRIYFSDLSPQKRHEILSAQVSSIWIALDGNTEPLFPMK